MELMFDVFDVNDDQKVDKKEMLKLLEAVYAMEGRKSEAKQKLAQIFGTFDRDGSGALSKQEFFTALKEDNILSIFKH